MKADPIVEKGYTITPVCLRRHTTRSCVLPEALAQLCNSEDGFRTEVALAPNSEAEDAFLFEFREAELSFVIG